MTIVLLTTAPIIEKIVSRLAEKRGDMLYTMFTDDAGMCDVVIVDDSVGSEHDAQSARMVGNYALYLGSRFEPMPTGYDRTLPKPFLPDELNRVLDDAELALRGEEGYGALYDADEADLSAAAEQVPVFSHSEIEELKQLLDAVDLDELNAEDTDQADRYEQGETTEPSDESHWSYSEEETVEDTGMSSAGEEETEPFADIDLHERGAEALQDLMAILSDRSVARAFKAMGVRVDISFGEEK